MICCSVFTSSSKAAENIVIISLDALSSITTVTKTAQVAEAYSDIIVG